MVIYKALSAIAAVALGAGMVLALPGFSPEVEAGTGTRSPAVKSDRLDHRPLGAACSRQVWPYYEAQCLRDRGNLAGEARTVRLVTTDRVAAK